MGLKGIALFILEIDVFIIRHHDVQKVIVVKAV